MRSNLLNSIHLLLNSVLKSPFNEETTQEGREGGGGGGVWERTGESVRE